MKLKEYIEILSTFDQEVEVLQRSRTRHSSASLIEMKKCDIIPPHQHFKYNEKTGRETLVDSYIV